MKKELDFLMTQCDPPLEWVLWIITHMWFTRECVDPIASTMRFISDNLDPDTAITTFSRAGLLACLQSAIRVQGRKTNVDMELRFLFRMLGINDSCRIDYRGMDGLLQSMNSAEDADQWSVPIYAPISAAQTTVLETLGPGPNAMYSGLCDGCYSCGIQWIKQTLLPKLELAEHPNINAFIGALGDLLGLYEYYGMTKGMLATFNSKLQQAPRVRVGVLISKDNLIALIKSMAPSTIFDDSTIIYYLHSMIYNLGQTTGTGSPKSFTTWPDFVASAVIDKSTNKPPTLGNLDQLVCQLKLITFMLHFVGLRYRVVKDVMGKTNATQILSILASSLK
jgi:hypothetical protein